jgi:predicted SnoaL-like aldol condensation-catalyzing enzyme
MTTNDNKALVRRFYDEVWNGGHVDVALEVFADDYIRHDLRPTKAAPGGTFTGVWGDVAPTGRRATFSGVNIFRFAGGRVVELWNHRDDLGLMHQVGAEVFAGSSSDPAGPSADA